MSAAGCQRTHAAKRSVIRSTVVLCALVVAMQAAGAQAEEGGREAVAALPGAPPPAQVTAAGEIHHESPVTLVRSYFQAYTGGDVEGMLECYLPESRAAVQGMLSYVKPTMADASELRYEVASEAGDQATVKVTGPYVTLTGERKTLETSVKLRKLDTGWYLDDL